MMTFKQICIAICLTMGAFGADSISAQETTGKSNVFIDYFWRPSDVDSNTAEQLRGYVIDAINETNRVNLIDVDSKSPLAQERSRRETGDLSDGDDMERLAAMKEEGANALIQGRITALTVARHVTKEGSVYYDAVINYTLKAINPTNGKIISTKTIKAGDEILNLQTSDTPDEAVMKVCQTAKRGVKSFIEEAFPIMGTILDKAEEKKDEIKSVYISVGSDAGVVKGNKFSICVERKIAGRTSHGVIGETEVKSVEGGDISLAEVKKGGKELKKAMDAGQTIIVKSIPKKERAGFSI